MYVLDNFIKNIILEVRILSEIPFLMKVLNNFKKTSVRKTIIFETFKIV